MMTTEQAISILIAQHSLSQEKEVSVTVTRNLQRGESAHSKKAPSLGEKAKVVKARTGEAIFGMLLPDPGTLDAKSFMVAIRNAGKRPNAAGVKVFNALCVREDTIKAIAGYVGYDTRGSFAEQDHAARTKAQHELGTLKFGGKTRAEERAAYKSVSGYVAGICDQNAKRIAELQALEVALADSIIDNEKLADDTSKSESERDLHSGLAMLDRDRLAKVRQDLDMMNEGTLSLVDPFTGR